MLRLAGESVDLEVFFLEVFAAALVVLEEVPASTLEVFAAFCFFLEVDFLAKGAPCRGGHEDDADHDRASDTANRKAP